MKRFSVAALAIVVSVAAAIEGLMWWRNTHGHTTVGAEHQDDIEDELAAV